MKTNISNLKAHLSENLRKVKNGETIIIMERQTAIAKIVKIEPKTKKQKLQIVKATEKLIDMKLKIELPIDPSAYIQNDREDKWFAT